MLRRCAKLLFVWTFLLIGSASLAFGESAIMSYDQLATSLDTSSGYKTISKVKPAEPVTTKVKPSIMGGLDGMSRLNPMNWAPDNLLPVPVQGQFVAGPRAWFARIQGEARRSIAGAAFTGSPADFTDNLGLKRTGNIIWSVEAAYQLRPKFSLRYSFTPIKMDGSGTNASAFSFAGQLFAAQTQVFSRWERFEHRAGVGLNLINTSSSRTNLFAEWMYIQDKLSVGSAIGATNTLTWNDTRNMAVVGLEFEKALKNWRGNTLALNCKADVAFLSDSFGFDAETALNYMIPIKTGRFGFVKGGYKYSYFQKDLKQDALNTSLDGAFVQVGFLF